MKQLLTRMKNNYTNNRVDCIRTLLISEGFGFCFSLSTIMGWELDHFNTVTLSVGMILLNIVLGLIIGAIVGILLIVLGDGRFSIRTLSTKESSEISKASFNKTWATVSSILFLGWLPILLAYYPAVFSYDAEAQLYQVISGSYTTHHPLLHTLFLGLCMKIGFTDHGIGPGMTLYAVVQMILMATLLGWSIAELQRLKVARKWCVIYILFLILFPVNGILAISTTKDIIFAGLVVVFTLRLRRLFVEKTYFDWKLCVIAVFMLLLRNNAQYAFVLFLFAICLYLLCSKSFNKYFQIVTMLSLAFVLSVLIGIGLKSVVKADSGSPREALAIPIQQMARVKVIHGQDITDIGLRNDLDMLISDEMAAKYDEHLADPVKERISMKQPALFVKTWIKLGLKYPGTYIDAWLKTTQGAWYIWDKSCNRIYGEGSDIGFGYLSTDIRHMPEGFEVRNETKIPWLRNMLERLVSDNCFENIPIVRIIFAPALYFWIFIFYIYRSIINRNKCGVMIVLFEIFFFLSIMLSPAILVRYMYPYMLLLFMNMIPLENDKSLSSGELL